MENISAVAANLLLKTPLLKRNAEALGGSAGGAMRSSFVRDPILDHLVHFLSLF